MPQPSGPGQRVPLLRRLISAGNPAKKKKRMPLQNYVALSSCATCARIATLSSLVASMGHFRIAVTVTYVDDLHWTLGPSVYAGRARLLHKKVDLHNDQRVIRRIRRFCQSLQPQDALQVMVPWLQDPL